MAYRIMMRTLDAILRAVAFVVRWSVPRLAELGRRLWVKYLAPLTLRLLEAASRKLDERKTMNRRG
jgi:hypothetical protein